MPGISSSFSKETPVLWAGETFLCFALFYALLYKALNQLNLAAVDHAAVYALTFGTTALAVGIYRTEVRRQWSQLLSRTMVAAILSLPIIWCILYLIPIKPFHMPPPAAAYELLVWTLLIFTIRILFGFASQAHLFSQQVVVLGASPTTALIRSAIGMTGQRSVLASMQDLPSGAAVQTSFWPQGVWALVVDAEAARSLPPEVRFKCREAGIKVMPDSIFLETSLHRLDLDTVQPGEFAEAVTAEGMVAAGTRLFDILFAIIMMIAILPVMTMVAVAIKLQDGGPVFYLQNRVGLRGKEFTLFKFRSMRADAEAQGPVWAQQSDRRVTRIGAVIRKLRFDELPQLLNILRGEMSVIGPRPERPHFVEQLIEAIPCYAERALVKPGLTGWAQVNYPYGASIEDARAKLSYDLYYVKHHSLLLDVKILLATVRVVLFQEGAR